MSVNDNTLSALLADKPERPPLDPTTPSLQQYALSAPMTGYSVWTLLASMQNWITTVSTVGEYAEALMLNTASTLGAEASQTMNAQLEIDNTAVQNATDSNSLQQAQTTYSTDQTTYGTPVNDYQSLIQILSQNLNTLTSSLSTLVNMATTLLQTGVWIPN